MEETSYFYLIGFVLIILGMILIFYASYRSMYEENSDSEHKVEVGVIGFIGFIPFGFATSKKMLLFSLIIFLILVIIFILLSYFGFRAH